MQLCVKFLRSTGVDVVVSMVFGVPTIKRERESYLSRTLQSLIESLNEDESMDCLIVVMICEVRSECFVDCSLLIVHTL